MGDTGYSEIVDNAADSRADSKTDTAAENKTDNGERITSFAKYFADKKISGDREKAQVDCRAISQLRGSDRAVLADVRYRALENLGRTVGEDLDVGTFEQELKSVPHGVKLADKLVFRIYDEGTLLGYALVISGWPKTDEWAVERMYLDPNSSRNGIGSKLIHQIENLARTAEARGVCIFTVVAHPEWDSFWKAIGYEDDTDEIKRGLVSPFEFVKAHRKELV